VYGRQLWYLTVNVHETMQCIDVDFDFFFVVFLSVVQNSSDFQTQSTFLTGTAGHRIRLYSRSRSFSVIFFAYFITNDDCD